MLTRCWRVASTVKALPLPSLPVSAAGCQGVATLGVRTTSELAAPGVESSLVGLFTLVDTQMSAASRRLRDELDVGNQRLKLEEMMGTDDEKLWLSKNCGCPWSG